MEPNAVSVIARKRDGQVLTQAEIEFFIEGFTRQRIPAYQMSALAMAVYLRGMDARETAWLTEAMLRSGTVLDWTDEDRPVADKHSTGGVGDKVSLVLAPLLAGCGVRVPMISGRGLGPTGGTLDKLESIPGFRADLPLEELQSVTRQVGCVITGATEAIAPADRELYALRDVTGTVASIPLITASIMSKKLAAGLDALVLDVKQGSGAFMKTLAQARELAESLVATGRQMGVETIALITDMDQPLGRMVGNSVEVDEAISALRGAGPDDVLEVTLALGGELLVLCGRAEHAAAGRRQLEEQIDSGRAYETFCRMVAAQGGMVEHERPRAPVCEVRAETSGLVQQIRAERIGQAVIAMGGGRRLAGDAIDHAVGLEMLVRVGDPVVAGQPIVRLFARPADQQAARAWIRDSFRIGEQPPTERPLVIERVE